MNLICNGTLAFIRNPDQWERLRADPEGAARLATEECLRYDPPVKSTQRIAAEDVERRGKTIRKGDRLRWIMAAANRDRRAFDEPDRFDIGRQPNTHVSFGAGIHYCLGRLARPRRGAGGLPCARRALPAAAARDRGALLPAEHPVPLADVAAGGLGLGTRFEVTPSRRGVLGECEARTQGAFVAGGYGRNRGRRIAPSSAARRHRASF